MKNKPKKKTGRPHSKTFLLHFKNDLAYGMLMSNPLYASMSCPASRCIVSLCDNFHLYGQFRFQRLGRADQLKAWNPDDRSNLLQEVRFQLEPSNRNPSCRSQKPWRLVHFNTLINYKNYVFWKFSCLRHLLLTMLSNSPRPYTTWSRLA